MRRWVLLVLLVCVLAWGARTLWLAGVFRSIEPHFAGSCEAVRGIPGVEDIVINHRTRVVYLSSCDREAVRRGEPPRGAIYMYWLDTRPGTPTGLVNATPNADPDFCPHGLALWEGRGGGDRLFAIEHSGGGHAIQVYGAGARRLAHQRTLRDPWLRHPNDLVAVGPDELYITNDHRYAPGRARILEEWLRLPLSDVVHWKNARFAMAVEGLRLPNGIQASVDGRTVYVAEALGRALVAYVRHPGTGELTRRESIDLGTMPDNVDRASDGEFWIGAHPKPLQLVRYFAGREPHAPSQVLRVTRTEEDWRVEEVYLDRGESFSGASVAARYEDRLLIGSVADDGFLDCQLP